MIKCLINTWWRTCESKYVLDIIVSIDLYWTKEKTRRYTGVRNKLTQLAVLENQTIIGSRFILYLFYLYETSCTGMTTTGTYNSLCPSLLITVSFPINFSLIENWDVTSVDTD